tara:strand:- start:63 stop:290 length:228 start_codon:yes stop_codon:yes gene_type:complete
MTAMCGLAQNYAQLFLARIGVGVGEATLGPAAYSMLADTFPPRKLGVAMGVFNRGHTYDIRVWLSKKRTFDSLLS